MQKNHEEERYNDKELIEILRQKVIKILQDRWIKFEFEYCLT